jgi:hypothetical protein
MPRLATARISKMAVQHGFGYYQSNLKRALMKDQDCPFLDSLDMAMLRQQKPPQRQRIRRQSIPRSPSMPSKYPASSARK